MISRHFPVESVRAAWEAFPGQHAVTQRFTLGVPRSFVVSGDGGRVAYLQSAAGDDPVGCLWVHDVGSGAARVVADPRSLDIGGEEPTAEERTSRERMREAAEGITSFATDAALTRAAFTLGGQPFLADLASGNIHTLDTPGAIFDPHLDPLGRYVAFA